VAHRYGSADAYCIRARVRAHSWGMPNKIRWCRLPSADRQPSRAMKDAVTSLTHLRPPDPCRHPIRARPREPGRLRISVRALCRTTCTACSQAWPRTDSSSRTVAAESPRTSPSNLEAESGSPTRAESPTTSVDAAVLSPRDEAGSRAAVAQPVDHRERRTSSPAFGCPGARCPL
jgi:hypothetical protein